jgi:hypothetical protein
MIDFTITQYEELLKSFSKFKVYTVQSYIENNPLTDFIILRHDVDRDPINALKLAELESKYDFKSTYYFRCKNDSYEKEIIKTISELGHEIGYHYEVLSKSNGNIEKALDLFKCELNVLKKICDVKTISMHGSPLSKYNDQRILEHIDLKAYNLLGDAIKSIIDTEIFYFTDTGRNWNKEYNIRDKHHFKDNNEHIKNTSHIIKNIKKSRYNKIYFNIHPERWARNDINLISSIIRDNLINLGKSFITFYRPKNYE